MKGFCVFVIGVFTAATAWGQNDISVPVPVKIQFMEDFISATQEVWCSNTSGVYRVDFKHQGYNKTAAYKRDGTWMYTQTHISTGLVPATVLNSLSNKPCDGVVDDIIKAETGNDVTFTFKIISEECMANITIHKSGKVLKQNLERLN